MLRDYATSLAKSVGSGPFFKAYLANLLPGQFVQPFVDAAFSDLGLDPNVLLPSQRVDPQIGQPGTPPLPVPFPRTGQGGEPRLTPPDAITGNPGDPAVAPGAAARPHRLLPLPGTAARTATGRSAARARPPTSPPAPDTRRPCLQLAPGEGARRSTRRLRRPWRPASEHHATAARLGGCAGGRFSSPGSSSIQRDGSGVGRTHLVAYFDNSNGIFVGDEVRIVGVPVGEIDEIEPQPMQVKISFWLDDQYKVPADAKAVILSPSLVTSRAIQLTPPPTPRDR